VDRVQNPRFDSLTFGVLPFTAITLFAMQAA